VLASVAPRVAPRVAIVLFNLGGPDRPEAIKPFLLNLFTDPAILRVPFFLRPILARFIVRNRFGPATANYALLGGRSPLLELTRSQAAALEAGLPELDAKCFVTMRYWHPLSDETAGAVRDWRPDEVVLLPLYPHYSSTTTGSSLTAWREAAARAGLAADTTTVCCYATDANYVAASTALLRTAYDAARVQLDPTIRLRVLFSAHGLPEIVIRRGDPYQWQIEQTVSGLLAEWGDNELDWVICYQSRATPQQWIRPSTESEIERAAHDRVAVLIVPVSFVSDHSETLVEIDVDYRALADRLGVAGYFRVPAENSDPAFIAALAQLVRRARSRGPGLCSYAGGRVCPVDRTNCPHDIRP
jgi:protoporphyrin/coproporphyrin ferrochelatase